MNTAHYDAIVVGAGPSGAIAAYELARAGARTLVIEKAKLPRYKTCGGGVTYKVAKTLPFSIEPVVEREVRKVDLSWKTGSPAVLESSEPLVYLVQRSRFDNYLTEQAVQAGAALMDETALKSLDLESDRVTVQTTHGSFSAGYLVGADGATGRVGRALGLMSDRQAIPALESEVEVDDEAMSYWRDKIGLDIGTMHASYGWVFPKGEHLSVGVGGYPRLPDYGARLKRYDEAHTAARVPGMKIRRVLRSHGYLLPLRRPGAPVQKGRAMLVGDAAGLVEAFTGEGIYWAVRSGQIAAQSILSAQGEPGYQRRLDTTLMPDLLTARRWMHVYFWVPRSCYSLPKRLPIFWEAVCHIVRGERHFTDIHKRLGPLGIMERLLPYTITTIREQAASTYTS